VVLDLGSGATPRPANIPFTDCDGPENALNLGQKAVNSANERHDHGSKQDFPLWEKPVDVRPPYRLTSLLYESIICVRICVVGNNPHEV
jgi:hypothetical protein